MSAILGLLYLDGKPVERPALMHAGAALDRFGGDGEGVWTRGNVGLVHRLMHFTPEDAFDRQPVVGEGTGCVLAADVRLDNRDDLIRIFGLRGGEANRCPDSVLVLKAYERWGEACPRYLLGDFAFVVWDEREQKLFCARDHCGSRVLFYHHSPNLFVCASTAGAILRFPEVPRRLHEGMVADFVVGVRDNTTDSFYQGIHRLLPAHTLVVVRGGVRMDRYWSLEEVDELRLGRDEAYLEQFRSLFAEAVRCRTRSRTPVGVMMSGGLDSTSVACLAAGQQALRQQHVSAFSAVPRAGFTGPERPGKVNDERALIEAVRAHQPNLDVTYVTSEGRTVYTGLDAHFAFAEYPAQFAHNRIWMEAILETAAANGVRVVLDGQCGNMTVSNSGSGYLYDLLRAGRWLALSREVSAVARRSDVSPSRMLLGIAAGAVLPASFKRFRFRFKKLGWSGMHRFAAKKSYIHPDLARERGVEDRWRHREDLMFMADRRQFYTRLFQRSIWNDLPIHRNAWKANYGTVLLDPTGDRRLVEFCLAIPQRLFRQQGVDRWLMRRGMEGVLPPVVLQNRVRGLQAADWFERFDKARPQMLDDLASFERSPLVSRMIDVGRLRAALDAWPHCDPAGPGTNGTYGNMVTRGIIAGRFLQWYEHG